MRERVLLLIPTSSYKAEDFLDAALRLDVQVVVGSDRRQALERLSGGATLMLDFARPEAGVRRIVEEHTRTPFAAVIGVDDDTTLLAAVAAQALGLAHNPPAAVRAARDKLQTRERLQAAGRAVPWFFAAPLDRPAISAARKARYPCVLKPLGLSGSRGVLRADDAVGFEQAFARIAGILDDPDVRRKGVDTERLIVEEYLPGGEVALEGVLRDGRLQLLALFDKPDPLEGPTFAETIYVTPSRLAAGMQSVVEREVAECCDALGLRTGPVHAELRIRDGKAWLLEVAPRTIGGLCSRVLRFGTGVTLEEIVLRNALGDAGRPVARERRAAGVMMIPVPRAGCLRAVQGLEQARSVAGIDEVTLTVHRGAQLVPLPEGDRYVGFLFARGATPAEVEHSLRAAYDRIELEIV